MICVTLLSSYYYQQKKQNCMDGAWGWLVGNCAQQMLVIHGGVIALFYYCHQAAGS